MNERLKLKTFNGDTVWGGVPAGKGTRPSAQNRQKLPVLDPKIMSLKHPDFWLPVLHDLFAARRSAILTPIGGRRLYFGRPYQGYW